MGPAPTSCRPSIMYYSQRPIVMFCVPLAACPPAPAQAMGAPAGKLPVAPVAVNGSDITQSCSGWQTTEGETGASPSVFTEAATVTCPHPPPQPPIPGLRAPGRPLSTAHRRIRC